MNVDNIIERNTVKTVDLSLNKSIIPKCILNHSDEIKDTLNIEDPGLCADITLSVQEFKERVDDIFDTDEEIIEVQKFLDLLLEKEIDKIIY